jgi:SHS2 domain-containing protein
MDDRKTGDRGYREISHTADLGLQVWASDLLSLFETAAQGMYALTGVQLANEPRITSQIDLESSDLEGLLVQFLDELLYLGYQNLAYDRFYLFLDECHLMGSLHGAPIAKQKKEIKAVTYHNLAVLATSTGYEVSIIFDV